MGKDYEQNKYMWFWSNDKNDNVWQNGGSTIERCIDCIEKNAEPGNVYIAKGRKAKPIINLDRLLEDVCESIGEQVGEVAIGYCEDIERLSDYESMTLKFKLESMIYSELKKRGVGDVYEVGKPLLIYKVEE